MEVVSSVVVYIMVWWVVFLMALPIGVHQVGNPDTGHDHGAPKQTYLKHKILITSIISVFIWWGIMYLIRTNFIDFRAMA